MSLRRWFCVRSSGGSPRAGGCRNPGVVFCASGIAGSTPAGAVPKGGDDEPCEWWYLVTGQGLGAFFAPQKPKSKFRAVPVVVDGIRFDSKLEAGRWQELKLQERAGEISGLRRQVDFPLDVLDSTLGCYRADFTYTRGGVYVIEDAKGVLTPLCRWKLKHMAAQGEHVTLWPPRQPRKRRKT